MDKPLHHILLVDDSKVNRMVAEAQLKEAGFEVKSVENGRQALEILEQTDPPPPFDAVLLDIMMPEIDGLEVLQRTRQLWNSVQLPILMATAKDQPEDVVEALKLGANDYVTKPIDVSVLLARLNVHLDVRQRHEALKKAQHSLMNAARTETTGLLAAGVAHEIRNPLAQIQMAVGGLGSFIEQLPDSEQEAANFSINTIEEAVKTADDIVKNLMQASQAQQLELIETDFNHAVSFAIDTVEAVASGAGATLISRLADDLPPVMLNEDEFLKAFIAIVNNALQAMQVANSEPRILTIRTAAVVMEGIGSNEGKRSGNRLRDGDQMVALYIEDTGPGLSKNEIESAFDAFFTTKATGAGTGLGLTVAGKIIELHHGEIRLENRADVDSGTRVSIFLGTSTTFRTSV
jgi:DNA-binding response OmpR family regulator